MVSAVANGYENTGFTSQSSLKDIEDKIRQVVNTRKVRLTEYFKDFDRLRTGFITSKFEHYLCITNHWKLKRSLSCILKAGFHTSWSRKSTYDLGKIKNQSHKWSHKLNRIRVRRIRIFQLSELEAEVRGRYHQITKPVIKRCDWFIIPLLTLTI